MGYHFDTTHVCGQVPVGVELGLERNGYSVAVRHDSHADAGDVGFSSGCDSTANSIVVRKRFD